MSASAFFVWGACVMLASVRLAMLFIATPVFAGVAVPVMARIILIFGLAAGFVGGLHLPNIQAIDLCWLVSTVASEILIGTAMASSLFAGFGAFHFGGRLLDFQIGFGIAGLVDIATRNNAPLLGSVLTMLAVLIFFTVDGHLAMLRILHMSFDKIPIGSGISSLNIGSVTAYFSTCFVFGFAVVAPVVLCLLLVDIGVAFMSRTMPQMNVFVMSLGLKVIVGLIVLAISVPFASGVINSVFNSIFDSWNRVLR